MTKAEVITRVSRSTGIEKLLVSKATECFMDIVKESLSKGEPVYIRGFGSFVLKKRAKKIARNIRRNTAMEVPAHYIAVLKPSKEFSDAVKNVKIKE